MSISDSAQLKRDFSDTFQELINDGRFKQQLKDADLDNYKYEILSNQYRSDVIDLFCYQFSYLGQTPYAMVFNILPNDSILYFEKIVDHTIKCGLGLLVLDCNNQIAACATYHDLMDPPNYDDIIYKLPKSKQRECEMDAYLEKAVMQQYISDSNGQFGNYCATGWVTVRPDLTGKNRNLSSIFIIGPAIFYKLQYKASFINIQPKIMIYYQRIQQMKNNNDYNNFQFLQILDYSQFRFHDGITTKDYINQMKLKYNLSESQLNSFKKSLQIGLMKQDFDAWKQRRYDMIDVVIHDMYHRYNQRIKTLRPLSKL